MAVIGVCCCCCHSSPVCLPTNTAVAPGVTQEISLCLMCQISNLVQIVSESCTAFIVILLHLCVQGAQNLTVKMIPHQRYASNLIITQEKERGVMLN